MTTLCARTRVDDDAKAPSPRVSARGVTLLMADLRVVSVGRRGSHGWRSLMAVRCWAPNVSRRAQVTLLKEGKCTVDITLMRLARS